MPPLLNTLLPLPSGKGARGIGIRLNHSFVSRRLDFFHQLAIVTRLPDKTLEQLGFTQFQGQVSAGLFGILTFDNLAFAFPDRLE